MRGCTCAMLLAIASSASFAQEAATTTKIKDHRTNPDVFFLQEGDVPNSYLLLPPPPDGASITFLNDQARYTWGKTMRNTPRGDQAVKDARVEGNGVPEAFSEAFGIEINENTPEILKLIIGMREDAGDLGTREAKNYYNRQRPAVLVLRRRHLQSRTAGRTVHQRLVSVGTHFNRLGDRAGAG